MADGGRVWALFRGVAYVEDFGGSHFVGEIEGVFLGVSGKTGMSGKIALSGTLESYFLGEVDLSGEKESCFNSSRLTAMHFLR